MVSKPTIAYCMVVLNRKNEMIRALEGVSPYVDKTFVLDGGSTDGTIEWLEGEEAKALNIEYQVSKQVRLQYGNHTPGERNKYLEMAKDYDWILVTDSDEFLEQKACEKLYKMIDFAEQTNSIDGWCFRAHDITTYETGEVYDNVSDYYNPMFFKCFPNQHYSGHTHSHIVRPGARNTWAKADFEYLHVKTEKKLWHSSTYLYWTTAEVAQNTTNDPTWLGFHEMMKKHGFEDWHEFNKVMLEGTVPPEIKNWFIEHKDAENPEERSWFVLYFIWLHPEQNIDKVGNRDKEWDYVEQARRKREDGV